MILLGYMEDGLWADDRKKDSVDENDDDDDGGNGMETARVSNGNNCNYNCNFLWHYSTQKSFYRSSRWGTTFLTELILLHSTSLQDLRQSFLR